MQNSDFISRLITARHLAEAHGFKNTEAALAKLINECIMEMGTGELDFTVLHTAQKHLEIEILH